MLARDRLSSILLICIFLPSVYVASYLVLIKRGIPEQVGIESSAIVFYPNWTYRLGGQHLRPFFHPLRQVDLQLRPDYWVHRPAPPVPRKN